MMTDDEIRPHLGPLSWVATASGRRWSSEELQAKIDELPTRFEAAEGKLPVRAMMQRQAVREMRRRKAAARSQLASFRSAIQ